VDRVDRAGFVVVTVLVGLMAFAGYDQSSGPVRCPAAPEGDEPECGLGPPGKGFDAVVDDEVEAFQALVDPPDPLYEVERLSGACWRMTRTRNDPRSGYGLETELCVDRDSGALRSVEIDHGRIQERTTYDDITTEVSGEDLEP
jgi:hypothetical protein